jgi:hypothetical protein
VANKSGVVGITINDINDLRAIGVTLPLNGNYILADDLLLADWVPIGDESAPFTGAFDGAGHTLTLQNFNPSALAGAYLGVFGYVRQDPASKSKAALENIKIFSQVAATATDSIDQAIGLLAGYTENTDISGVTVSGTVAYKSPTIIYAGGVVGYAQTGTVIQYCLTGVEMNIDGGVGSGLAPGMYYNYVGGVAGLFMGGVDILNCHNTGNIRAVCTTERSQVFCGGIAGGSYYQFTTDYQGRIENCSSLRATILAQCPGYWSWAGGIAGCIVGDGDGTLANTTRIVNCYATGAVTTEGSPAGWPYVGGIVGYNYYGALVSKCSFNGDVLSNTANNYTGGIAGYNSRFEGHNSRIEDCWSAGTVRGLQNAGGIVGQNQIETYVSRCYSIAYVFCSGDTVNGVGGIAGLNASEEPDSISACVAFNVGISASSGSNIHRIVGRSTTASTLSDNYALDTLKPDGAWTPDKGTTRPDGEDIGAYPPQSFYEGLGWNFTDTWMMDPVSRYPILR